MYKENKIRILIADDHPFIHDALKNILLKQSDFEIVGEASDGQASVKLGLELVPDVILMDITMPIMDGLEATRILKEQKPDISILILTVHDEEDFIVNLIQAGADGYLIKRVFGNEVISAIRAVHAGDMVLSPDIIRRVIVFTQQQTPNNKSDDKLFSSLTLREIEIFRLMAKGNSNKEIALRLGLSLATVKGHLLTLFARLNAKSRTEALVIGLKTGIIDISDLSN
ncbi:MAG: response regulator transcription factor [Dehalococcoidales bacterium]|nr:response regulator transcription factor [Dehalococcoidales bacterium]